MAIQFSCEGCGSLLSAADEHAGKKIQCPSCQQISRVPGSPAGPSPPAPKSGKVQVKCGGCGKVSSAPKSMAGKKAKCPRWSSVFVVPGSPPAAPATPKPSHPADDPFGLPDDLMSYSDPFASSPNPYAGPSKGQTYSQPAARRSSSRSTGPNPLMLPAIFLIIISSLWMIIVVVGMIVNIFEATAVANDPRLKVNTARLAGQITGGLAGIGFNTAIILGASAMIRLKNYRSAFTASILGMIPCCGGCVILSIPFAIWAFVLLKDPAVERRFKNR